MDADDSVTAVSEVSAKQPSSLKLVVGLGNPGIEYAGTRHNMGFMLVDELLGECEEKELCGWQPAEGILHRAVKGGREMYLLKPMTYMNSSGRAVGETAGMFGISPQELLVVSDDLDMPLGRIRLRMKGSSGGHRGIASVAEYLGCSDFPRLRLGIGRPQSGQAGVIDYVLNAWTSEDAELLEKVLVTGAGLVLKGLADGLEGCTVTVEKASSDKDNAEVQGVEN